MLDLLGVVPIPAAVDEAFNVSSASVPLAPWMSWSALSKATLASDDGRHATFLPALILLLTSYPLLYPSFPALRQRAWILTAVASFVMTCTSLPYVYDYVTRGGALGVREREWAVDVNRFFQAYLTADMLAGFFSYRSQIGLLTGWIHHVVYILITETAIRSNWAHLFCLAAVMELPTFILGISTLIPKLRSNVVFAVTFFATRIAFHVVMFYGLVRIRELRIPATIVAFVFPLHAMWFRGCIAGFVRRHKAKVAARSSSGDSVVVQKAPEIGIDGSDKSGSPPSTTSSKPVSAIVQGRLDRLRVLSSTLLEGGRNGGGARWLTGPAGWVSPGVTLWLERGRGGGRWGLRNAILTRLAAARARPPRRPIRPRAAMMARRMSASLIAVLPKVPGREVREKVMGYVRGTLAAQPPMPTAQVQEVHPPPQQVKVPREVEVTAS